MGNSGSVHHLQSGFKELNSYYQVQPNEEHHDDLGMFNDESNSFQQDRSLPRLKHFKHPSSGRPKTLDATVVKNSQIKVLPRLSENPILRSTTNGAILQSGGTISGRRESFLSQPLERSKTFITENQEHAKKSNGPSFLTRRSQTQVDIDLRNGNRGQMVDSNLYYKSFRSNLDLRQQNDVPETEKNTSVYDNNFQKLCKVKIKNKKRKPPPLPPPLEQHTVYDATKTDRQDNDLDRKQRLFKTKTETNLQATSSHSRQQPSPSKPSSPVMMRMSSRSNFNAGFRREKSFDATLLSKRNESLSVQDEATKSSTTSKRKSLQLQEKTIPSPVKASSADSKLKRTGFTVETPAATKLCLMTRNAPNVREPSSRQREPYLEHEKRQLLSPPLKSTKPEAQSKIPQLKRTFYFGMENSKQKPTLEGVSLCDNNLNKNEILSGKSLTGTTTNIPSFSLKEKETVYSLNHKSNSEIDDNGIRVNVRPILPKRQLEIPRFSPVTAWKTLSEENRKPLECSLISTSSSPNLVVEAKNAFCIEDRIHRTYREPCPFYPDNKSADSGISGDDVYIAEKPIQPTNLVQFQNECNEFGNADYYPVDIEQLPEPIKVVGPFLTTWTPQQDLEEDTSSDGGEHGIKMTDSQSQAAAHVFSLSLPRENQLSVYSDKAKPDFRSLQKLKRSTSAELNNSNYDCIQSLDLQADPCSGNYRSDNWVLSKTLLTSLNSNQQREVARDQIDVNKKNSYFDLSDSIQSMSLGCLATGKHVIYLPNRPVDVEARHQSALATPKTNINSLQKRINLKDMFPKNTPTRNKRFSYQSSVRRTERRRLAEKLSKEADQKEALRKSELEAMRRVEEEFQRKRAYEKASIRHQLRLYSMDDDNFTSLPADLSQNENKYRAEPDGAVSSRSESPLIRSNPRKNMELLENRTSKKGGSDIAMIFAYS